MTVPNSKELVHLPFIPPKISRPFPAPFAKSATIEKLREDIAQTLSYAERLECIHRFWQSFEKKQAPIVEAMDAGTSVVTFVWQSDTAQKVLVFVNRITDETAIASSELQHIPNSDIWHLSYVMENDWRASYSFLLQERGQGCAPWEGQSMQGLRDILDHGLADPRNTEVCLNRVGVTQSVVSLPDAPEQSWLAQRSVGTHSHIEQVSCPKGRTAWIYMPEGIIAVTPTRCDIPLLIMFDGDVWVSTQNLPQTLDNLILDGEIPPVIAVLLDCGDRKRRWDELNEQGDGIDYLALELMPWLRKHYPVGSRAQNVVVAGQSLGGLSALLATVRYPDVFGAAISQSGALWRDQAVLEVIDHPPLSARIVIQVGRQEWVTFPPTRFLAEYLEDVGVDVTLTEYNGGHDYAWWRGAIADGLRSVFSPSE